MISAFACGYLLRSLPVEAIVTARSVSCSHRSPRAVPLRTAKVYEYSSAWDGEALS